MAQNKQEYYNSFSKYDKNIQHAQAVSTIGNRIEYWLTDVEEDINRISKNIETRVAEKIADEGWKPSEDWDIKNWEAELINCKEMLAIWKKLDSVLEKELAF